ncbi:MAG: 3-oxoacyl-ACP synthase III family protein [Deltaproteobacteria bacterium]
MQNRIFSVVSGIGSYLPDGAVTSREVDERLADLKYLNVSHMVESITGVKERRHAPEGVHASDIAVFAAKDALSNSGHSPEDVDTILYTSCSRDLTEPATASIVQAKLGAVNARRVMDVTNACNSFLSGLEVINSLIAVGQTKIGLVVAGERLSTVVNWNLKNPMELKTGFAALTLGDGGGAFVVTPNSENGKRGIVGSHFFSDGREWELSVVRGGGTISPRNNLPDTYFHCDSLRLNRLAMKHIPEAVEGALEQSGFSLEEIELVVPHQVSLSICEKIASKFNYPMEKIMVTLDRYGNMGAASIPFALKEAVKQGRVFKGSPVLLLGGAAGFSAIGTILVL